MMTSPASHSYIASRFEHCPPFDRGIRPRSFIYFLVQQNYFWTVMTKDSLV